LGAHARGTDGLHVRAGKEHLFKKAWGLGPAAAYVPDPSDVLSLRRTVQRVVLAFHLYNKQKLAEDSSPNDLAASLNAARAMLFR